jgi:hypothetical protein
MAEEFQTQIVREAPEIEAYKLGLLKEAQALYGRQMNLPAVEAAGLSPGQQQAAALARQGIGAFQPYLEAGSQGITAGQSLAQTAAGQLTGMNVAPGFEQARGVMSQGIGGYNPAMTQQFMNPYQEMVTQKALEQMRRQGQIAEQQTAAQAVRSGAFGGTREGVQRAEQERNLQDLMSQRVFQDYAANFGQAQTAGMTAFEQERQRQLAAGQGLGALTAQEANINLNRAGTLGQFGTNLGALGVQQAALGQAQQQLGAADVNMLSGVGALEQAAAQAKLDASRATQLQETMAPYQQLGFVSDIYKGAPSSQMSLTSSTAPTASPFQSALGTVVGGVTTAAAANRAGLF